MLCYLSGTRHQLNVFAHLMAFSFFTFSVICDVLKTAGPVLEIAQTAASYMIVAINLVTWKNSAFLQG